jgi:hypothetical protein
VPEREEVVLEEPVMNSTAEEEAAAALAGLSLEVPGNLSTGGHTEGEHESKAQKRRVRRKRTKDNAHKIRRSLRLRTELCGCSKLSLTSVVRLADSVTLSHGLICYSLHPTL